MPEREIKRKKVMLSWVIVLILGVGMACQITSPRPASWAGTPTAEAWSTEIALTQAAIAGSGAFIFTPTVPTSTPVTTPTPTTTPTHQEDVNGPWLVFPAPEGQGLHAYDISAQEILEIELPGPIIAHDLIRGMAPDGSKLILRAGSPLNTDELALYQVDLPSFEVSIVSPLLSITVQRKIVNDEGTRVLETLMTVTRPDGLAWSPDGRFLAFTASLHNETSDLYVLDTLNDRIDRLNGLFTQNASPVWSPGGDWLISQELEYVHRLETWRSELVSGLRVPSFDSQNTIYIPPINSLEETFVDWLNPYTFISYSITDSIPRLLRQVNVEELEDLLIFEDAFQQVAYDPGSGVMTFSISFATAITQGLSGGIYRLVPDSPVQNLQAAGDWTQLTWDPGGMFVASGTQGVLLFTPQGESILLPDMGNARLSPNGNWLISWGDGEGSAAGARLFQSNNSNPLQTLIDQPVETLIWQPDSKGFFILSEGSLYHFVFPGLRPDEIIAGLPTDTMLEWAWVE
jgi:hypothetical protein